MDVMYALCSRRSVRRFTPHPVQYALLRDLVDVARLAPSAANRQPLQFVVVDAEDIRAEIFPLIKWASYVRPHRTPPEGMEPTAYIVILADRDKRGKMTEHDIGAAAENIMVAATAHGLGSCWIGAFSRPKLREILEIPEQFEIDTMIALGYPAEAPVVEEMDEPDGSIEYWLDADDLLHVPKRPLEDILSHDRYGAADPDDEADGDAADANGESSG